MKIIFLDVDGVLNDEDYYVAGKTDLPYPLSEFNPKSVELLNYIVDKTNAKIVLSASMRADGIDVCRNLFVAVGIKAEIISITPHINNDYSVRGNEILKWIQDNKLYKPFSYINTDHDYVILDDDGDMLLQQKNNFFQISPKTGLTKLVADKIIKFLNKC
jgi:hypothetical protein